METHVGNFCMVDGGADGLALANPQMRVSDCTKIGFESSEAEQRGLRQSVAFANFVNVAEERTDGQIRYRVTSLGNTQPLLPYPATIDGPAASWNEIALVNNRVQITLMPDGFQ